MRRFIPVLPLVALAASAVPAGAQSGRQITEDAVLCGGAALALRLLYERRVDEGQRSASRDADRARAQRLAIGLHAARATGCGMAQQTYEIGTSLAAELRLRAVRRATARGWGLVAATQDIEDEVAICFEDRGGRAPVMALIEVEVEGGRYAPCGWRQ